MIPIHLTQEEFQILKKILSLPYTVLVFGSRIKGMHQPFSDIDICLKDKNRIPLDRLADLKMQLSDSNLTYHVDIIDYHSISSGFKSIIDRDGVELQKCKPKHSKMCKKD